VSIPVTVTGTSPTGTVTLTVDSVAGAAQTLVSGSYTFTLTDLSAGSHSLSAAYSGDTNNGAATNSESLLVSKATLTVTAASPSIIYGQSVPSYTAGYNGWQYSDSSTSGAISGAPSLTTTPTTPSAVGSYAITAAIGSLTSTNYSFSFVPGTLTIGKGTASASVSSSASSTTPTQSVTLTATVSGPGATAPSGSVSFYSGVTLLGTGTLSSGTATYTGTLPAGTDSITVSYGGDSNYNSATSSAITVSVAYANTTTSLTSSLSGVVPGQPLTLTATVSGTGYGMPTGTVTFSATSTGATQGILGTSTLVNGVATYYGLIWGGTDSVTATYNGDSNYGTSTSSAVTVNNYPNTGKLSFNWPFVSWGQAESYGASSGAWPVTVQNLTGVTVNAPTFSLSGAFAANFTISGSTCSGTLAQGASCNFNVYFTPTIGGSVSGTTTTATLTASTTTSSNYSATLSVSGIAITSSLTFNWPFLNFTPSVAVGVTSSNWPVTLYNQSGTSTVLASPAVTFTDASFAIASGTDNCSGVTLGAGRSCTFAVNFTPLAGDITQSGTNIISGTMAASGNSGAVTGTLPVSGWATAALGFNWPFVTFQTVTQGATGNDPWPVTVTNYSGQTLTGLTYALTGANNYVSGAFTLTNTCSTLAAGASCVFDVVPTPQSGQATGAYSAMLVVTGTTSGSTADSSYSFPISGSTIAGGYSINWNQDQQNGVSTIDFGPQNVAGVQTGPWPITVYNNTPSTEMISLTPSLSQFTTDVSSLSNVPAGGSATFNLYFTPTVDTGYHGTLTIAGGGFTCVINTWGGANK